MYYIENFLPWEYPIEHGVCLCDKCHVEVHKMLGEYIEETMNMQLKLYPKATRWMRGERQPLNYVKRKRTQVYVSPAKMFNSQDNKQLGNVIGINESK
jgi:hypothetical protein